MILMVGATGVVGGIITRRLLDEDKEVRILVRRGSPSSQLVQQGLATSAEALIESGAHPVHGDLRDRASLDAALEGADARYGIWWYGRNRVRLTPDAARRRRSEALPESEWIGTPVPDSGIPRGTVEAARASLDAAYRPRAKARHRYELAGTLYCSECGLRMSGYSTGTGYRYYTCQKRRKWGRRACGGPSVRAEVAEREILGWAEGLLLDPDGIARRMDEAIEAERVTVRDPQAAARALADRTAELDRKRERLLDLAEDGLIGKDDLGRRLAATDAERRSVERELARAGAAAGRVEEAERAKRALVGAFATGLKLGLTWMPPQLRREVYGALGLRVIVRPDGGMYAEARVDAAVLRFSCEVERYAEALMDAERRIEAAGPEGKAAGLDRAERELARVRRELSSGGADMVMAEVAT